MICYVVFIEYQSCEPGICKDWQLIECPHGKATRWLPHHTISLKVGPANATVSRAANQRTRGFGMTGNAEVMTVDTEQFKPWLTEDERAAYLVGGLKAAQKIKKAKERAATRKLKAVK